MHGQSAVGKKCAAEHTHGHYEACEVFVSYVIGDEEGAVFGSLQHCFLLSRCLKNDLIICMLSIRSVHWESRILRRSKVLDHGF